MRHGLAPPLSTPNKTSRDLGQPRTWDDGQKSRQRIPRQPLELQASQGQGWVKGLQGVSRQVVSSKPSLVPNDSR